MSELIVVFFSIIIAGFFSGYETGFVSFNKIKLYYLQEKKHKRAKLLLRLFETPENILSTTLIGTNIAIVFASTYFTVFIENHNKFGLPYYIKTEFLVSLILTPILLIFGEILPKTIFRDNADKLVVTYAVLINIISKLFYIFNIIFNKLSAFIIKILGVKKNEVNKTITKDELEMLVDIGDIDSQERKMIKSIFDFSDLQVKEIMVPRIKIKAVKDNIDLKSLYKFIDENPKTRIPVYTENIDKIIGFINTLDLIYNDITEENYNLKKLIRKPLYVPETKDVDELFSEMRKKKKHIAIVVDEYGGTAGLVSLEDIIEEIFGEIYDEFDKKDELRLKKEKDGSILLNAFLSLNDLEDELNIKLDCESEDIDTIGGYLINHFGKIPKSKEKIVINKYEFEIVESTRKTIKVIRLRKIEEKS